MKKLLTVVASVCLILVGNGRAEASAPGYVYLSASSVALAPAGFGVWVDPKAPHHSIIARNASVAITALRRLGVHIRLHGYGVRPSREGVIQVRESRNGCGVLPTTVGETWTFDAPLPHGKTYVSHADVYFCPRLFRLASWATRATITHELGHALGLGHVAYRYRGSYQLMNPFVHSNALTYQSGDRRGLARLVRGTNLLREKRAS